MSEQIAYFLLGSLIGAVLSFVVCRAYYENAADASDLRWRKIFSDSVHRHAAEVVELTQGPVVSAEVDSERFKDQKR